jgi:hypothetical protein
VKGIDVDIPRGGLVEEGGQKEALMVSGFGSAQIASSFLGLNSLLEVDNVR